MAYSELIKNFEKVRNYMREFYVYGFKSRDDFKAKSSRSYDDEKRRIESWIGNYMKFSRNENGKNVFISIDSRDVCHNPLYNAWKSKSFTDGDITLHFIIFDILYDDTTSCTLKELSELIHNNYLAYFDNAKSFDDSTIRKKLNEYIKLGLITSQKQGRTVVYKRNADININEISDIENLLDFYSETAPCGEAGSFLIDKTKPHNSIFTFKHHYITVTLDSSIMLEIFKAIKDKQIITITNCSRKADQEKNFDVVPLRIFASSQNGRQYLQCYNLYFNRILAYRLDYISKIKIKEYCPKFDAYKNKLDRQQKHMWGVNCSKKELQTEHIEFTVHFDDDEKFIYKRLVREKRCGKVTLIDDNNAKFVADVYDTSEIKTWIRTFICRITSLEFSDKALEQEFLDEIKQMYKMYLDGDADV